MPEHRNFGESKPVILDVLHVCPVDINFDLHPFVVGSESRQSQSSKSQPRAVKIGKIMAERIIGADMPAIDKDGQIGLECELFLGAVYAKPVF